MQATGSEETVDTSELVVFVTAGMLIAAGVGWRIGAIMTPRPEALRRSASSRAYEARDVTLADDDHRSGSSV